jgi:hypothetical protein
VLWDLGRIEQDIHRRWRGRGAGGVMRYSEYVSQIANADPRADDGNGNNKPFPVEPVGDRFRCWIGRTQPEITCGVMHHSSAVAQRCAERLARIANLQEIQARRAERRLTTPPQETKEK